MTEGLGVLGGFIGSFAVSVFGVVVKEPVATALGCSTAAIILAMDDPSLSVRNQ